MSCFFNKWLKWVIFSGRREATCTYPSCALVSHSQVLVGSLKQHPSLLISFLFSNRLLTALLIKTSNQENGRNWSTTAHLFPLFRRTRESVQRQRKGPSEYLSASLNLDSFQMGSWLKEVKERMGCVASKLDINDVHPNMFAVNNVDDVRLKLCGFLQMFDPHQSSRWGWSWTLVSWRLQRWSLFFIEEENNRSNGR